jgi:hypothetical protein
MVDPSGWRNGLQPVPPKPEGQDPVKNPQTYALLPNQTSRRLRCSLHGCYLVLHRTVINTPKHGQRTLELFACPVPGCTTRRANKHQAGGRRANIAKARTRQLEQRVDKIIGKLETIVDEVMKRED